MYSERYTKLYDSGFFNTLQDFTWEWQEFKEDLQYELIDFFMTNKDLANIFTDTNEHCYTILSIVQTVFNILEGSFTDYIAVPKTNMYQSLQPYWDNVIII